MLPNRPILSPERQPSDEESSVPVVPQHAKQQPKTPPTGRTRSTHQGDRDLPLPTTPQTAVSGTQSICHLPAGHFQHPRHVQGPGRYNNGWLNTHLLLQLTLLCDWKINDIKECWVSEYLLIYKRKITTDASLFQKIEALSTRESQGKGDCWPVGKRGGKGAPREALLPFHMQGRSRARNVCRSGLL